MAFSETARRFGPDPLGAFVANLDAYHRMPLQSRFRRQLILTLQWLKENKGDDAQIGDQAADRIYEISRSTGPDFPGVLLARLKYLALAERNPQEIADILNNLKTKAAHKPEVQALLEGIK